MSIKRINEFHAKESKGAELLAFLQSVVKIVLSSEGCIACEILQGVENPLTFIVLEEWETLKSHKRSAGNVPPEMMLNAMNLFATLPKGAYYKI